MIDYDKIHELKTKLLLNDECVYIPDVLKFPEQFASFVEICEVVDNPEGFSLFHIAKKKHEKDTKTGASPILKKSFFLPESANQFTGKGLLEKNSSILVTNWERKNENAKKLRDELLKIFHVKFENHGIWPAETSSRSGHVHMYCGSKESNSFPPHTDHPNNIIFQVEGVSKWIFYKNRVSTLVGKDEISRIYKSDEDRHTHIYNKLEIQQEVIASPGDMCYIPARTYHQIIPMSDRISISFPLILKGPWAHGGR